MIKSLNKFIKKKAKIRKLPYPYKGALSISYDIDYTNFTFFEELMKFLNSNLKTRFGFGLGLEVSASIFFYSKNPYNFSYFDGIEVNSPYTKYKSRIIEYLQAGWIDTNHSYGDFDNIGGFTRAHAEKVVCELLKFNIKLSCYTNHGDIYNFQNIGNVDKYHRGDLKNTPYYHTDLFYQIGTKFVWTILDIKELYWLKNRVLRHKLFKPLRLREKLLRKGKLRDGTEVYFFTRFRSTGKPAPNLASLIFQLDSLDFRKLYKNQDSVILYQHLGVLYKEGRSCIPATVEAIKSRPELFLSPFYRLAKEAHEGRLWITTTSKLLEYHRMLESIEVYETGVNKFQVYCKDEEISSLSGLTIYIDPKERVEVLFRNQPVPILYNGPDETQRYSVTVPMKKNPSIW